MAAAMSDLLTGHVGSDSPPTTWGTALLGWPRRRWYTAIAGAIGSALLLGLPTDVIPNPVFGRQGTPVTWWSYVALAVSSILSGLLLATYVKRPVHTKTGVGAASRGVTTPSDAVTNSDDAIHDTDAPSRVGSIGAVLTFFAIGCPICNKLVLLAVGAAGATRWFAPVQPWLAVVSIVLLAWALRTRLRNEISCPLPSRPNGRHVG